MAYTKTVWANGDVITAAKLNNAEDGIAAAQGVLISGTWSVGAYSLEKTFAQIEALVKAGVNPVIEIAADNDYPAEYGVIEHAVFAAGNKTIVSIGGTMAFFDANEDDVPVYNGGGGGTGD